MAGKVVQFVEKDQLDDLVVRWKGFDVSVFANIKLFVQFENGKSLDPPIEAVVDSIILLPLESKFHFEFGPDDLIRGQHPAEIKFFDVSGKAKTLPTSAVFLLDIRPSVG